MAISMPARAGFFNAYRIVTSLFMFIFYNPLFTGMTAKSVLLCVHGYTRQSKDEKSWEEVIYDRLETALRLARFLKEIGVVTYLVLSGGLVKNSKVEADVIYEYAKKKIPELFGDVADIILERESKTTQENVDEILKWAIKKNAAIIAISSKDHAPRVMKDWAYDKERGDHLVLIAPSKAPYSIAGEDKQPITIEAPFWAYDEVYRILDTSPEKRADIKKALDSVLH